MITINARGARTIADARPLVYGGMNVYVTVSYGVAELHLAGRIVAERPAAEVETTKAAQDWAYETIEAAETVVAETTAPAVKQVRESATVLFAEADAKDEAAATEAARPSKARIENPRHPLNRAARIKANADALRIEAEILASWTAQDEAEYIAYISEGLGATDGYYAPKSRTAWKRHQSR